MNQHLIFMKNFTKHLSTRYGLRFVFLQFLFAIIYVQPCLAHEQTQIVVNGPHIKGLYVADPENYMVFHYEVNAAGELINQPPQAVSCPHATNLCSDSSHNYIYVTCGYGIQNSPYQVAVTAFPLMSDGRIGPKRVAALDTSQSGNGMLARNLVYNSLYIVETTNKVFFRKPPRFKILIHSLKFQSGGRLRTIGALSFVCSDFGPLVFNNSGHYAYLPADGKVLCFRISSSKVLTLLSPAMAHNTKTLNTTALIANRTKPYVYSVVGRSIEVRHIETNGQLAPASEITGPVLHLDNRLPYDNQLFIDPGGHFLYEIGPFGPLLGFKISSDGTIDTTPFLASTLISSDGNTEIQFHPLLHIAYVSNGNTLQAYHIQTNGKFVPNLSPPIIAPSGSLFQNILVL